MEQEQIIISIGGLAIGFRLRNRKLLDLLTTRYKGYCRSRGRSDCLFSCFFSRKKIALYQRVKQSMGDDGFHYARRYDFDCRWNKTHGTITLWPSLYSFDACLRVILAGSIIEKNGLLLHASAVVYNNSAFVFAGPSGSGKTTIAGLAKAPIILSDEIIALQLNDHKGLRVFGTPFWGEMGSGPYCPKSYAIRSIFFLKKNSILRAVPIGRYRAVNALLRCVCLFGKEPKDIQTCLDTCSSVVKIIDCQELYFPKKPLEWEKLGF